MSWPLAVGIVLLVVLLVARNRFRNWIFARWAANEMFERRAKLLLFLVSYAPTLAGAAWIAAAVRFPWGPVISAVLLLALVPSIGMSNAMLDHRAKYVLKREPPADQNADESRREWPDEAAENLHLIGQRHSGDCVAGAQHRL